MTQEHQTINPRSCYFDQIGEVHRLGILKGQPMTATIIEFLKKQQIRVCSFCKKPESQCKKFIASNVTNHCICGECVKVAADRANEKEQP